MHAKKISRNLGVARQVCAAYAVCWAHTVLADAPATAFRKCVESLRTHAKLGLTGELNEFSWSMARFLTTGIIQQHWCEKMIGFQI